MIFQQFGLLPWRTVRENVGLGLELRGEPAAERRRIVDEKLELVGLSQWADRYGHELSGGMQQRVGLARAFATDADILLMDEPFSALDPLIRSKLQDELRSLQQRVRKIDPVRDARPRRGPEARRPDLRPRRRPHHAERHAGGHHAAARECYVAEFVRHMNPLSVLNGRVVMRPLAGPGAGRRSPLAGLRTRQYELLSDEQGRPLGAQFGGRTLTLCEPESPTRAGLVVADARTPLRQLIAWLQETGHPVLLTDADGFCGVCGPKEVIRALAGSEARRGPGSARVMAAAMTLARCADFKDNALQEAPVCGPRNNRSRGRLMSQCESQTRPPSPYPLARRRAGGGSAAGRCPAGGHADPASAPSRRSS